MKMVEEREQQRRIDFGDRLRRLRESKNIKQVDMARELSISPTSYMHYEQGKREPSIKNLIKIANILGVTTDFLIFSKSDKFWFLESIKKDSYVWRSHGFFVDMDYKNLNVFVEDKKEDVRKNFSFEEFEDATTCILIVCSAGYNFRFMALQALHSDIDFTQLSMDMIDALSDKNLPFPKTAKIIDEEG